MAAEDWFGIYGSYDMDSDSDYTDRPRPDYRRWRTRTGEHIPVEALSDSHLARLITLTATWTSPWHDILLREQERRVSVGRTQQAQADPQYASFAAGWAAAERLHDHEWGPTPPTTPEAAFLWWKGREG